MKLFIAEADEATRVGLQPLSSELEVEFMEEPLSPENASKASDADLLSVFIYSKLTASLMRELPKLKFICTRSTGYDHIDLQEAERRGITVSNVVGYGTLPV
ncbi:MAG: hydroxyacid dehydrogenase, partial [Thermoprotei archaeon]